MNINRNQIHVEPDAEIYTAWTDKQVEAFNSTRSNLYTLFGGAKGGGKTVGACRLFQTDISNYRGGLFVVMRRNYTDLVLTTQASFRRFFPQALIEKDGTHLWLCVNDNTILFYHADIRRDPNYEAMRGLEATAIAPDEATQFDPLFYEVLPSLLRRPAYHVDTGEELHPYIYMTCNPVPGFHWIKDIFIDPETRKDEDWMNPITGDKAGHKFIQSLPESNPLLPEHYISTAFSTMSDDMIRMLKFGEWDLGDNPFQLVTGEMLENVKHKMTFQIEPIILGIDIGLGKPDTTEVYEADKDGRFRKAMVLEESNTMRQVDALSRLIEPVHKRFGKVLIDKGDIGAGVVDRLAERFGNTIEGVMFGERADDPKRFVNSRAEMYWNARTATEQSLIYLEYDKLTFADLTGTYYIPKDKQIQIESKDVIKKRLGRSPNSGDAFVLCLKGWLRMHRGYTSGKTKTRTDELSSIHNM